MVPQVSVASDQRRPSQKSSRPGFTAGFTVNSQRGHRLWREGHCSIISLRFSCRMVSFTAWKTKRMFSVSTAVVKWWKSGFPRFLLLRLNNCTRNAWKKQRRKSLYVRVFTCTILTWIQDQTDFYDIAGGLDFLAVRYFCCGTIVTYVVLEGWMFMLHMA